VAATELIVMVLGSCGPLRPRNAVRKQQQGDEDGAQHQFRPGVKRLRAVDNRLGCVIVTHKRLIVFFNVTRVCSALFVANVLFYR
jgi:hypothetical protein